MKDIELFLKKLHYFDNKFKLFIYNKDHLLVDYLELCALIDEYSSFIINHDNETQWNNLGRSIEIVSLVQNLRKNSSVCVQIMEKYRLYY